MPEHRAERLDRRCWLCGQAGLRLFQAHPLATTGTYTYLRCPRCGLARLAEQSAQRDLPAFYAQEYQPVCGEFAAGRRTLLSRLLEANFHRVARRIERDVPRGRLLDVGCGAGVFLAVMRRRGWDVAGIEPNLTLARDLRERRGLDVHAGTLEDIPEDFGPFDALTLFHVVEHLPDPAVGLEKARRLLRPGGVLVAVTPNVAALEHRLFGAHWYALQPPDHLWLFSRPSLLAVATRAELSDGVLGVSPVSYGWVSLRRSLGLAPLPSLAEASLKALLAVPLGAAARLAGQPAELELYARRSV